MHSWTKAVKGRYYTLWPAAMLVEDRWTTSTVKSTVSVTYIVYEHHAALGMVDSRFEKEESSLESSSLRPFPRSYSQS